ncbi:MAG TPA: hypothetical protein VF116_19140 [Ktedonobacterales bacterium]
MSDPGPVRQQLTNLLGAYGYNLYDDKNRMRADDLLVRGQAAAALGEATNALRDLRAAYRRQFIPPPSREQPYPPADRMAQLDAMARLQERAADLETRIRNMAVPPTDRVWARFRDEARLLGDLLLHDYALIAPAMALRDQALALTPDAWSPAAASALNQEAAQLEAGIRARQTFLQA